MYDVLLARQAGRDLKRLPAEVFHRIIPEIQALANDPRPPGSRKLFYYLFPFALLFPGCFL